MVNPVAIAHPHVGDAEVHAAVRVMRSRHLGKGTEVAAFEDEFAALVNGRHCVAGNSGTAALHPALLTLGIGRGDEVTVPSFTFGVTAHAVALTGATPVFADIDPDTFCLDPDSAAAAITARTAALLPVHLFGHPAPMEQLTTVAHRHSLAIVEDAAQALGARLHGAPVGALGDMAGFSFYRTKNIHSIEGGMVVTGDPALADRLRRNQGMNQRYQYEIVGLNARMTDVAAAVGRVQLRSLPRWVATRRANAAHLTAHLRGAVTPPDSVGAEHVYHQYTVRLTNDRDTVIRRAARRGVVTAVFYPVPVPAHRTPVYQQALDLPHADDATAQVLSLPVHPALTTTELDRIITAVNP